MKRLVEAAQDYADTVRAGRHTPQPDGEWSKSGWHGKPNTQPAPLQVNKPPVIPDGQDALFEVTG